MLDLLARAGAQQLPPRRARISIAPAGGPPRYSDSACAVERLHAPSTSSREAVVICTVAPSGTLPANTIEPGWSAVPSGARRHQPSPSPTASG
ncbi:MAG: hypothetical protein U0168_20545 [Nannocystaceae bacterium]